MKDNLVDLIEKMSPGAIPLYLVIRGSNAYGTNLPSSDIDYSGVFIQDINDILGNSYVEQVNDNSNDVAIYEIRRFLQLLAKNNPTVLELLNTPEDCIIYKHPAFDQILENKDKFISKICADSFGGYAKAQISKAKGQNKKQNWEKDKVTRKSPLDFCFFHKNSNSVPLVNFFLQNKFSQEFVGLSKIPHSKDVYAIFYDFGAAKSSLLQRIRSFILRTKPIGFRGIAFESSNDVRLSYIPLDCPKNYFIGYCSYNKDAYTQHCKDYKSYTTWLVERNDNRWVDVRNHGQKIDGKNMMHCRRLMDMAREIAEGKGIIVRRENVQELIDIRLGKVDLQTLIDHVEKEIKEVDAIYKSSNLPSEVDMKMVEDMLIKIRKEIYFV